MMRHLRPVEVWSLVAILLLVSIGGVLFVQASADLNAIRLRDRSRQLEGATESEVVAALGAPLNKFSGEQYESVERSRIAQSFAPEPPVVVCDDVWLYHKNLRIVLVFFVDGSVTQTYTGLT